MNRAVAATPQIATRRRGRGHFADLPERFVGVFREERPAHVLVTVCLGVFAALAVAVILAPQLLAVVDTAVQEAVISNREQWLDTGAVWLTFLGTRWAIGTALLVLVAWSAVTGRSQRFVGVMVLAFLLNPVFEVVFKELVGRIRPNASQLLPGNGPSFPSGHVLASVGFYGMLPFMVWEATKRSWARVATLACSTALILGITATRVYLDVHWTTDAVAGLMLGTVLVAGFYHVHLEGMLPVLAPDPVPFEVKPALAAAGTGAVAHRLK